MLMGSRGGQHPYDTPKQRRGEPIGVCGPVPPLTLKQVITRAVYRVVFWSVYILVCLFCCIMGYFGMLNHGWI